MFQIYIPVDIIFFFFFFLSNTFYPSSFLKRWKPEYEYMTPLLQVQNITGLCLFKWIKKMLTCWLFHLQVVQICNFFTWGLDKLSVQTVHTFFKVPGQHFQSRRDPNLVRKISQNWSFFFFLQTKHSESHYITCNFKTQQLISSHRRVAYMWQWCEISCPNTPSSYVEFERLERVALCCPHILYPGWKLLISKRLWLEPKARRAPSAYELQRWINKFHIHPQFFGSAVQLYRGGIFALSAKRNKSLEGGECFAFENTQHTFVLYVRYEC